MLGGGGVCELGLSNWMAGRSVDYLVLDMLSQKYMLYAQSKIFTCTFKWHQIDATHLIS